MKNFYAKYSSDTNFQLNFLIERASPTALPISEFLAEFRNSVSRRHLSRVNFAKNRKTQNSEMLLAGAGICVYWGKYVIRGSWKNETPELPAQVNKKPKARHGAAALRRVHCDVHPWWALCV